MKGAEFFITPYRDMFPTYDSWWDVCENIASGRLLCVLPGYYSPDNVWAVYVSRLTSSARTQTTVEFLRHYFQQHYPQH